MICRFIAITLFFIFAVTAHADQTELEKIYSYWSQHPNVKTISPLLDQLYFVYLTDGQNPTLHSFYNALRHDPRVQAVVSQFRQLIVTKYTFDEEPPETSALWAMPTMDARRLFLASVIDHNGIPEEIRHAMYKGIYSDIERCFGFDLALRGKFRVFPIHEYQRLMEILIRISAQHDFFLKSWDLYCRAVVDLNLGNQIEAEKYLNVSKNYLNTLLNRSNSVLAKKIILLRIAETSELLNGFQDAQAAYVKILQMDPQDYHALNGLQVLLRKTGACEEEAIWIEATGKSNQQLYDITIHCGSQELPENPPEPAGPVVAQGWGRCVVGEIS